MYVFGRPTEKEMDIADKYLGQITHIIDPDNFSMQIGTDESLAEFIEFEMRLEDFGQTCCRVDDLSALEIGQIVLVECMEANKWRRGQVAMKSEEESAADIDYIDYGNSEHVNKSRLCTEFPEEFQQYPIMALKCQLSGIRPIARTWTTKAVKMFTEITHGIIFHTFFLPSSNMFKSMVALYFQQGADNSIWAGRSLSHVLMDQELGIVSNNEITEFLENAYDFCQEKIQQATFAESNENYQEIPGYGTSDEISNSEFSPGISNGQESIEEIEENSTDQGDFSQWRNPPAVIEDNESYEISSESSSNSPDRLILSDTESCNAGKNIVISDFNIDLIDHTKDICTNRLVERVEKEARQKLEQENERIMEDVKECKSLAVEAGYGEVDNVDESLSPRFRSTGPQVIQDVMRGSVSPKPARPSPVQTVNEERLPSKRYSLTRREARPGVEERIELGPFKGRGRGRAENKSNIIRPSSSSPLIGSSGPCLSGGSPVIGSKSSMEAFDHQTSNTLIKSNSTEQFANSASPEKREEMVHTLKKIFSDAGRDSDEETRVRLQSLFFTDLYMYLDKEQLQEVIYLLLNRAVRYYGDIHDVLLDIIHILSATEDFSDCLYLSCKRIEENYIKIQLKGSPFHLQASKVLAHLFIMSLHWTASNKLHEMVLSALEKWIIFNKTAHQSGQDKVQEMYLECFNTVWGIVGSHICKMYPDQKARLQRECRDKILNDNVSRLVRSKLLDIYIEKFIASDTPPCNKEDEHTQGKECGHTRSKADGHSQTQTPMLVDRGVQTDMVKITGRQSQPKALSPIPAFTSNDAKNSKSMATRHKAKTNKAEESKDLEWPKLTSSKPNDLKMSQWSSQYGSNASVRNTHNSMNSNLYPSTEKSSQGSVENKKRSPYTNPSDNLRGQRLNPLKSSLETSVISESQQTFTNWSDNMAFGSQSNFLPLREKLKENSEDERKSKLLQSKVFEYVPQKSDNAAMKGPNSTPQEYNLKGKSSSEAKREWHSSSKRDFQDKSKSKSREFDSLWDPTDGSKAGSGFQSSVGSGDDSSSGSEKRPKGRGRGRGINKEDRESSRSTTPVHRRDHNTSKEVSSSSHRRSPLRHENDPVLQNKNMNANSRNLKDTDDEKSLPKNNFDWFMMEEREASTRSSRTASMDEDNVPDNWDEASNEENSSKGSQNSDITRLKTSHEKQVGNSGDSSSLSPTEGKGSARFEEGDNGGGDGPSRHNDFLDNDEGDDDALWETESSDDEMSLQLIDPNPTASQNSGVSRWVPGGRKCTLCGGSDHVIHKCPMKKEKSFFL
ncbi:uncharacterized protein LOC111136061 isoform X2 [Crassostrea virginica]